MSPPGRARLVLLTLVALATGALIVLGAILPAERNVDVLGLGRLTGFSRLWAAPETSVDAQLGSAPVARDYGRGLRTDTIEIPLSARGEAGASLEYKVSMKTGATLVYEWEVVGPAQAGDLLFDFHGHTLQSPEGIKVSKYKQGLGLQARGALTAPFDGIEGWLFANSAERPIVIRLRLSGFYDLIPPGDEGNLAGIAPNLPAGQARTIAPSRSQ
jgi:hypothetical protein